ncbi:MAG TPA: lactate utilization protein [Pyrinomonadaceae bacterium]|nr:lactate utilization protein [Pyrinomonadaceae bacterium]
MLSSAREEILGSIRKHLAASAVFDVCEDPVPAVQPETPGLAASKNSKSLIELFADSLKAVDGHCVVVDSKQEVLEAVRSILSDLRAARLSTKRIAISDADEISDLPGSISSEVDEVAMTPSAADLFGFDVGISSVQGAIAETGTLVLEADREQNRLISLVPPVHIAILDAAKIFLTLGEILAALFRDGKVSPSITFISGPSRTADIELTLAIGVHGPQELYVIVKRA